MAKEAIRVRKWEWPRRARDDYASNRKWPLKKRPVIAQQDQSIVLTAGTKKSQLGLIKLVGISHGMCAVVPCGSIVSGWVWHRQPICGAHVCQGTERWQLLPGACQEVKGEVIEADYTSVFLQTVGLEER